MNQTQHLQKILLMMAKDIDAVCKKYNIPYYLLGGTSLGAKRHKGFIPWDDDFDIVVPVENYDSFLNICKKQLPSEKYYVQCGLTDWPEDFSKIKLRNTEIFEKGNYINPSGENGIYIDVFRLDHGANSYFGQIIQYVCGKLWLSYTMSQKGYKPDGLIRKLSMSISKLLNINPIKRFIRGQYLRYNNQDTMFYSEILGRARFHNAFTPKDIYGKPTYTTFENFKFPVQEMHHEYLSRIFGNYMDLPPEEDRKGLHITSINFGKY